MFSRRQSPSVGDRVREMVWPKAGWLRWSKYLYQRILRLTHSPHAIAIGFCAGVFASFTPFIGFHFMIGILIAWCIGGSLIASAFGTAIGNPLTFPAIWASTYHLGSTILGIGDNPTEVFTADTLNFWTSGMDVLFPIIQPMLIGGIPLGLLAAALFYFPVRGAVRVYRARRSARIKAPKESMQLNDS